MYVCNVEKMDGVNGHDGVGRIRIGVLFSFILCPMWVLG